MEGSGTDRAIAVNGTMRGQGVVREANGLARREAEAGLQCSDNEVCLIYIIFKPHGSFVWSIRQDVSA